MDNLSDKQLADRCRRQMRGTKLRAARSLKSVCLDNGWSYDKVYKRLERAGLRDSVIGIKYETAE